MAEVPYDTGLAQLTDRTHAYLQPDGGFGLANSGLVVAGDEALLVDTFFDLPSTRRLLSAIDETIGVAIRRVVNTHGNGDHCWGNQLVADGEIIGHRLCPEEMAMVPPAFLQAARAGEVPGEFGTYLGRLAAPFDFAGIELTPPTTLFDDELTIDVGGTEVCLRYVGPAHTGSDVIVSVPGEGVVFAGDIVFRNCHPFSWRGTFADWIAALKYLEALDVDVVVSGHGPVCGKEGATEMREYFEFVQREARGHYEAGRSLRDAALATDLGPYARWHERERIVHNMARAYRELGADVDPARDMTELFTMMAEIAGNA